jgi:hypothetical protein
MLYRPNFRGHTSAEEAPAELTPIQSIQKDRIQIQFNQFKFELIESRFKIQTLCSWRVTLRKYSFERIARMMIVYVLKRSEVRRTMFKQAINRKVEPSALGGLL